VEAHRDEFRISSMCRVLRLSRSGYYAWRSRGPSPRALANARLLGKIRHVHAASDGNFGAVKTWEALRQAGECCGHNRVARLRQVHGIEARRMRRFRAIYAGRGHNGSLTAPNLLERDFKAPAPDRVWVGDVSFIPTREGWLYLAVLLDLYSRRVVGWSMSSRINQPLVTRALSMAITQRRPEPGLIHHTDQGMIYASAAYRAMLDEHGMVASMSRKGDCWDNAVAESFFSNLKNELTWHRSFRTREEARVAIFDYIELFYNRCRLHQTLGYRTPVQHEEQAGVS